MLIRLLATALLVGGIVQASPAQVERSAVRYHPEKAAEVVWLEPGADKSIYRHSRGLLFETPESLTAIDLPGLPIAVESSEYGSRVGALIVPSSGDGLILQVYAGDGILEMEHMLPHHTDDRKPELALSDVSPHAVYARPSAGEVCFIAGDEASDANCITLFEDVSHALERNVLVEFSSDGRHVAVAAQRDSDHPNLSRRASNAHLFLFDRRGSLIWRRPLDEPAIRSLVFLNTSLIGVSTYDSYSTQDIKRQSRLYTISGDIFGVSEFGADAFDVGDEHVLLITARTLATIDLTNGESRIVYTVNSGSQIISAAAGVNDGGSGPTVLVGQSVYAEEGFVFESMRLLQLNSSGMTVEAYTVPASPHRSPFVWRDAEDQRIFLILDDAVHVYPSR